MGWLLWKEEKHTIPLCIVSFIDHLLLNSILDTTFFQNLFTAKIIHVLREKSDYADSSIFNLFFNKESN